MRAHLLRILCVACALASWCPGAEPGGRPAVDPALAARVSALLRDLDADDYRRRDAATAAVEALPGEALPLIEDALATGALSPEVSLRLEAKVAALRGRAAATAHEAAQRRDFEWARRTTLAAYDGGGHTNPKWDAAAREALVLHVRPDFDPTRSTRDDARIAAAQQRALDLGCDDPFFLYVQANRYRTAPGADPRRALQMMDRAADGVLAGPYPPVRKLMAAARRADATCRAEAGRLPVAARRAVARDLATALSLFAPAAAEGAPRAVLFDAAAAAFRAQARLLEDDRTALESVRAAVDAAAPGTGLAELLAANVHLASVDSIRARRESSDADKAKAQAAACADARAALDAALARDPQDVVALTEMLRCLTYANAPRGEFDRWFDRAMAAYPNNLRACQLKQAYLARTAPAEERIAFARECLAGGNWYSRIPLIAVDTHLRLSPFDRPEAHLARQDVWNDVAAASEGYLKRYPNAVYDRTEYAKAACLAGRWDVAKTHFDHLGDDGVHSVFRGKQTYDYYRRKADRIARGKA